MKEQNNQYRKANLMKIFNTLSVLNKQKNFVIKSRYLFLKTVAIGCLSALMLAGCAQIKSLTGISATPASNTDSNVTSNADALLDNKLPPTAGDYERDEHPPCYYDKGYFPENFSEDVRYKDCSYKIKGITTYSDGDYKTGRYISIKVYQYASAEAAQAAVNKLYSGLIPTKDYKNKVKLPKCIRGDPEQQPGPDQLRDEFTLPNGAKAINFDMGNSWDENCKLEEGADDENIVWIEGNFVKELRIQILGKGRKIAPMFAQ